MGSVTKRTKIEIFPKSDWTSEQVDHVGQGHLAAGALECVKSETSNGQAWKLTTVWAVLA